MRAVVVYDDAALGGYHMKHEEVSNLVVSVNFTPTRCVLATPGACCSTASGSGFYVFANTGLIAFANKSRVRDCKGCEWKREVGRDRAGGE